jgi:hypothetical protein
MARSDSKGEKILAALAAHKNCELTPAGSSYIVQRFDPYHDKPIRPVGYPDSFNGHTVSRCVKKTMSFTYKSGGAPDQTTPWDVNIFMTPLAKPQATQVTVTRHGNTFTWNPAAVASKAYGGLMAVAQHTSGTDFVFPAPGAGFTQVGQLSLSNEDLDNAMRVTSMGFEVIDGTAELYRQGILTTYRQNQPQREQANFTGVSIEAAAAVTRSGIHQDMQYIKFPPVNTSNALLFPDSKQWKTSEGAYVDIDFNSDEIPMLNPQYVAPIMLFDTDSSLILDDQTSFYFAAPLGSPDGVVQPIPGTAGVGTEFVNEVRAQRILPINQSGVILTGLNPLATITVNAIYYLECAPTSDDQELLSLASQSPSLDTYALMIISKLRHDSPIAVKLRENYTGEWFFNGIRDIIAKVSPWLSNAAYIGQQATKWIDNASTNDGYINPQSFVKGSVAKKIAQEKVSPMVRNPNPPRAPGKPRLGPAAKGNSAAGFVVRPRPKGFVGPMNAKKVRIARKGNYRSK